jgi:proton glutamate symport protein
MARTVVNLTGNCLATAVMGRWEGEFNPDAPAMQMHVDVADVPSPSPETR